MKGELERLSVRLQELSAWRDRFTLDLRAEFKAADGADWATLGPGEPWPSRAFPAQMVFEGAVPTEWAGMPVWARLNVGGEGLLLVDGRALGGLNPFHREYPLLEGAQGGEVLALEVEAVPKGLFGAPVPGPKLEEARLVVPDALVRGLHADLACALDAAKHAEGDVANLLLDALAQTLARVRLPRGPAENYLNQLERSGWSSMTAQLWEEWRFDGPGLPLADEHRQSLEEAREFLHARLAEIRQRYPAAGRILATGHAHIDLAWLWPVAETRRKVRRTFATVLHLMRRYPHLHFNQSSAQAYAWLEQDDPELFAELKGRVSEGRWEVVGGMWVEPDGNLLSGESWARQILYGQRYFRQKFGVEARVAWLPDTFGFAANLPQILRQGGLPYFFTTKLNWNETNPFPHDLWQWEGLDGSRVLAHGFWNPHDSYNGHLEAHDLAATWKNFKGKRHHPATLYAFGHGDGGGGPTAEMLERQARYADFPGLPRAELGRVEGFYQEVVGSGLWDVGEDHLSPAHNPQPTTNNPPPTTPDTRHPAPALPVWTGEQYLELHRATYTTQAELKALNRQVEQALAEAELAWSLATIRPLAGGLALDPPTYPAGELEAAWKTLLLGQFHDILPGSGVRSVPQEAAEGLRAAADAAAGLREEALGLLSIGVQKARHDAVAGLVAWNLGPTPRPLRLDIPRPTEAFFRLETADGTDLPFQESGDRVLLACDQTVPPFGYLCIAVVTHMAPRKTPSVSVRGFDLVLDNSHLRVEVAPDGTLASVFDKAKGREVLSGRGNQIWAYPDVPRFWEAWDLDASYEQGGQEVPAVRVQLVEGGPARAGIRVERRLGASTIEQTYWLWAGAKRLEIETAAHWQERRTLLRALFPLAVRGHEAWYETAFGAVSRPTHRNTSWDAARFEVPALRWASLDEGGYGVSLLNDGKYGHSAHGGVLGLSLLRGGIWPDPLADVGEHRFTYALHPHAGDWRASTVAEAEDLNAPLRSVLIASQVGRQPLSQSFFGVSDPTLRVSAFKRAEEGRGYVLRLYEAHGSRGEATLDLWHLGVGAAWAVDLNERGETPVPIENNRLKLAYGPYQVISLRLEP